MVSCQLYLKIIIVSVFPLHEGALQQAGGLCQQEVTKLLSRLFVSVGLTPCISIPIVNLRGLGICTSGVEPFQCSNRGCSKPIGLVVAFIGNDFGGGAGNALGLF